MLEVKNLQTHFFTRRGLVRAVNDVSFELMPGETLGLVGESGSGKTITCLSILRLLPRGARIVGGQILFEGQDIVTNSDGEMEGLRGKKIGMILQNSMAALDPVFSIGTQVAEPLVVHEHLSWKRAMARTVELLRMVKITDPQLRVKSYPQQLCSGGCITTDRRPHARGEHGRGEHDDGPVHPPPALGDGHDRRADGAAHERRGG